MHSQSLRIMQLEDHAAAGGIMTCILSVILSILLVLLSLFIIIHHFICFTSVSAVHLHSVFFFFHFHLLQLVLIALCSVLVLVLLIQLHFVLWLITLFTFQFFPLLSGSCSAEASSLASCCSHLLPSCQQEQKHCDCDQHTSDDDHQFYISIPAS